MPDKIIKLMLDNNMQMYHENKTEIRKTEGMLYGQKSQLVLKQK